MGKSHQAQGRHNCEKRFEGNVQNSRNEELPWCRSALSLTRDLREGMPWGSARGRSIPHTERQAVRKCRTFL